MERCDPENVLAAMHNRRFGERGGGGGGLKARGEGDRHVTPEEENEKNNAYRLDIALSLPPTHTSFNQ